MNEEELKKIEQELLKQIDNEVDLDKQISEQAQEIATSLSVQGVARTTIDGSPFAISYEKKGKEIRMVAADVAKFQLVGEKYRPYTITAELDNRFSFKENLIATCEAFIRHLLGEVRPEPLEEGDILDNE